MAETLNRDCRRCGLLVLEWSVLLAAARLSYHRSVAMYFVLSDE
jgi:hypothetical protein